MTDKQINTYEVKDSTGEKVIVKAEYVEDDNKVAKFFLAIEGHENYQCVGCYDDRIGWRKVDEDQEDSGVKVGDTYTDGSGEKWVRVDEAEEKLYPRVCRECKAFYDPVNKSSMCPVCYPDDKHNIVPVGEVEDKEEEQKEDHVLICSHKQYIKNNPDTGMGEVVPVPEEDQYRYEILKGTMKEVDNIARGLNRYLYNQHNFEAELDKGEE